MSRIDHNHRTTALLGLVLDFAFERVELPQQLRRNLGDLERGGLAVLLAVYHPPGIERWAGVLFAIGFIAATVLGVYLTWNILRSGRGR